jgi:sulfite reductase alpha subunit-like flavoprotein
MINSWNFLKRNDLGERPLQNVNFGVFGLGDSSYEKFNKMAKVLTLRMIELGAK